LDRPAQILRLAMTGAGGTGLGRINDTRDGDLILSNTGSPRSRAPERLVAAAMVRRLYAVGEGVGLPPSPGLPIAIVVDVRYVPEATMRLVACLTMCLMLILANAAQTGAQAPSEPQGYCVNRSADYYPYTGEPCKSGYQLGSGNCRKTNGRMVAVPREECLAEAGIVELPFEGGIRPAPAGGIRPLPAPRR
jgi:hypothetical protein